MTTTSQRTRLLILAYLATGLVGLVTYFTAVDRLSAAGYLFVSLLPVVALAVGPRLHRPSSMTPWILLLVGEGAFFVGDVIWFAASPDGSASFPSLADLSYLSGYAFLGAGLVLFIRSRRPGLRLTPLVDASAIGMVGALVVWGAHVESFIHDQVLTLSEKILLLAYPIGDVLLLGCAAYLLLAGRVQDRAHRLLALAFALALLGDTSYLDMLASTGPLLTDAAWLGSYLLVGLTALVPSMRSLSEPMRGRLRTDGQIGLVALCLLFAAIPTFAIAHHALTGHSDLPVVVIAELVLIVLITLRAHEYARRQRGVETRFGHLLSEISSALAVVDGQGDIAYVSPGIAATLGYVPTDLVAKKASDIDALVHPDDRSALTGRLDLVRTGESQREIAEARIRHADGAYRWVRVTASDRRDDPNVAGIIYSYDDITAARLAGDRLRFQATILENIRESVIVTNLNGEIIYWNSGASEIFGFGANEMIGGTIDRLYSAESSPAAAEPEHILAGTGYNGQWVGRRRDGSEVIVSLRTSPMHDPDGVSIGFVGVARDVTDHVHATNSLRRLEAAIENASEAVVITDTDGTIEYVNPAFERTTGFSHDEAIGNNPRMLKSGAQSDAFYAAMWSTLSSGQPWVADFDNRRRDGTIYQSEAVISPIRGQKGNVTGFVGVSRDVSESRRLEITAQRAARERALIGETIRGIDGGDTPEAIAQAICRQVVSLTDVVTSGLFVFELDGRASAYGFALASGVDGPKRRVPKRRTVYLREQVDRGPWIESWRHRPGHPYAELFGALGVRAIAYAPVLSQGEVIGFLHISSAARDAQEQLSEALPALMEFADISGTLIGRRVAERSAARAERQRITTIIQQSAFFPVYQPLFDAVTGSMVGYEALTRFEDGTSPSARFGEAAAARMGEELELAAVRAALDHAADMPHELWLNVNASPDLVMDGGRLLEIVNAAERDLVIEVTEHSQISDYPAFRRAIHELGPRVRLAVDDAGAGFASLRHILELRPAFVKLDRELIAGIDGDEARQALVSGLRHFARNTGCWIIAEGVETQAELATLRELNIRYVQGYLLGRPVPAEKLAPWPSVGGLDP